MAVRVDLSGEADSIVAAYAGWASRATWSTLPPSVRQMTRYEVLDILGDMFAGQALLGSPPFLEAFRIWSGGEGQNTVIDGTKLPAAAAALINGYYAHALELDDTHDGAVLHAGASAVPAAIAAAQLRGSASGEELLAAIAIGIEITCRLGVATKLSLVEGGWIYSSLLAHFGAAVAASKILSNSEDAMRRALGMAYVLTCGNHQSTREGAETKHLQPAIAGSNGLLAALLAAREVASPKQPFLGEDGLNRVYLRDRLDAADAVGGLGQHWVIERLSFKPYPSCRLTHPPITAALEIRERVGNDPAKVRSITLRMGEQAVDVVGRTSPNRMHPRRRLDGQFSVFWAVGVALARGRVVPSDLVDQLPPTHDVIEWIGKIACTAEKSAAGGREVGRCVLEVEMIDGTRHVIEAAQAKGHPDNPMSEDELIEKFSRNLALGGIGDTEAYSLADKVLLLDQQLDGIQVFGELAERALKHQ